MSVKEKLDGIFENLRNDILALIGKGSTDTNAVHARLDEAKSAALTITAADAPAQPTSETPQVAAVAGEAPPAEPGAEGRDTPVQPEHPANTTDNRF